jgi:hypothetical protein
MSEQTLNDIHNGVREITADSYCLDSIAKALARIGMKELSYEIFDIATSVRENAKKISRAHGQEMSDSVKQSFQQTATVVSAVLAGIGLGREEAQKEETP